MSSPVAPREVAVVGAGMVGLSTAFFLQRHGVAVTVLDRTGVAAGASWGNAGWLTPGIATPLPEPAVLKYGVRAVLSPSSPVYVPVSTDRDLLRFLTRFARNSTMRRWRKAMGALVPLNSLALESFDELTAGGVEASTHPAKSFLAAYRTRADAQTLLAEFEHIRSAGQPLAWDLLDGDEAREVEPALSGAIGAAIRLHDQRFVNPGEYVAALADRVRADGGTVLEGTGVTAVEPGDDAVTLVTDDGERRRFDQVVLATGAWLGDLARQFGVRSVVQPGRGYSFSVPVEHVPSGPVYFPQQRVACTPLGDRLRVAGMMEFRPAEAPLDQRRIRAIVDAARPLLHGADLDDRRDEWVGSRPCTADGLPLIGATRSNRVHVAGGHGMWGITLGPATGRLLADQLVTGKRAPELAPFDPLR